MLLILFPSTCKHKTYVICTADYVHITYYKVYNTEKINK